MDSTPAALPLVRDARQGKERRPCLLARVLTAQALGNSPAKPFPEALARSTLLVRTRTCQETRTRQLRVRVERRASPPAKAKVARASGKVAPGKPSGAGQVAETKPRRRPPWEKVRWSSRLRPVTYPHSEVTCGSEALSRVP